MRPWSRSCCRMVGMLERVLVKRRLDQKPGWMVTACTGMLRSLAYGESLRFRMAWSFQLGSGRVVGVAGAARKSLERVSAARCGAVARPAAAVAAVEARKLRREGL